MNFKALQDLRLKRNLKQRDIGKNNIECSSISQFERGRGPLQPKLLSKYCDKLSVSYKKVALETIEAILDKKRSDLMKKYNL